jgi:nanoRNase/pAp phosphatase (c-di-AMP/oligoRNAs hydrolase)
MGGGVAGLLLEAAGLRGAGHPAAGGVQIPGVTREDVDFVDLLAAGIA